MASSLPESNPLPRLVDALEAARNRAGGDPSRALAEYDSAIAKICAELSRPGDDADRRDIRNLYKAALVESDQLVERIETPEYEASVPERDMLSAGERSLWQSSAGVAHTFKGDEITIEGVPIEGQKTTGVCSFGSGAIPPWHDVAIAIEFTIVAGGFNTLLRYEPRRIAYAIWFSPGEPPPEDPPPEPSVCGRSDRASYHLMQQYRVEIVIKASTVRFRQAGLPDMRDVTSVEHNRSGGIGFALEPGSKVVITSCNLKVLR